MMPTLTSIKELAREREALISPKGPISRTTSHERKIVLSHRAQDLGVLHRVMP